MAGRMRAMTPADVRARAAEAKAYLEDAQLNIESNDPTYWKIAGSSAVLGGIAASDAICGKVLGERYNGEQHGEARKQLDKATSPDTTPGVNFKRLTDEKTNYQYSSSRPTQTNTRGLIKALERLIERMDAVLGFDRADTGPSGR